MSETNCRWVASDQPRVLLGRHRDDCADRWADDALGCRGCQPCTEPHCVICRRTHADGACAECVAEVRADLHEIGRLCGSLPEEVEHRGVEGEAMMLLGPVAQPEQWRQRGRHGATYHLDQRLGEDHPLWVLGTWDMLYREELDHTTHEAVTLRTAVGYLDQNLSYFAGYGDVPFEDFARDLRRCVGHLEAVLHDGEQRDTTRVPCLDCGARLELRYGQRAVDDHHHCPRCRRTYTAGDFSIAKADHLASEPADRYVPISDAALAVERSQFTIRTWINREVVRSTRSSTGRLLVWWPDVRDEHRKRKTRAISQQVG